MSFHFRSAVRNRGIAGCLQCLVAGPYHREPAHGRSEGTLAVTPPVLASENLRMAGRIGRAVENETPLLKGG